MLTFIHIKIHTVSQKKRPNFETEIIRIDFYDIWQKYSEDSRIT